MIKLSVTILGLVLLSACGVDGPRMSLAKNGGSGGPSKPQPMVTLEDLQREIFANNNRCTMCHTGAAAPMGLNFDSLENTRKSLLGEDGLGIPSKQKPEVARVSPGNSTPEASYLIAKLIENPNFRIGSRMPASGNYLNAEEIELIRIWIDGLVD